MTLRQQTQLADLKAAQLDVKIKKEIWKILKGTRLWFGELFKPTKNRVKNMSNQFIIGVGAFILASCLVAIITR